MYKVVFWISSYTNEVKFSHFKNVLHLKKDVYTCYLLSLLKLAKYVTFALQSLLEFNVIEHNKD